MMWGLGFTVDTGRAFFRELRPRDSELPVPDLFLLGSAILFGARLRGTVPKEALRRTVGLARGWSVELRDSFLLREPTGLGPSLMGADMKTD